MNKNYYTVIMAGGVGSRFWPMSTQQFPKQFHDMLGTGSTLIQKTVGRFEKTIPLENILIATNKKYENLVLGQLPKISSKQLLLEPTMRNTAPCILYSAFKIYNENPDGIMVIAPSDHWIEDETEFLKNIKTAFDFCSENDALLTLGIQPTTPNTGYGYIQFENSENELKKVKKFTEKPNLEIAKQFLESGDYLWNAGIFIWSAKSILKAFKTHLPEMYALFANGENNYNTALENQFIETNYAFSENISIDFGIMEKASNVFVLPVNFKWNDLGTWSSLYSELKKDSDQNATLGGNVIYIDSANNIVKTQSKKRVVIQGLNDYIVVEKDEVILICPKDKEQDIKQITSAVKNEFGKDFV
ncbi:MAG: sugar phosphate nucleotidyltransferase [Lutibacter sp.]|nr:sugar phosphate nucleotidyltransferase [Lutibacter sp.]MDT8416437.1 sugar phosphate nucleotidyltransferase [Lutibacter sp.]